MLGGFHGLCDKVSQGRGVGSRKKPRKRFIIHTDGLSASSQTMRVDHDRAQ